MIEFFAVLLRDAVAPWWAAAPLWLARLAVMGVFVGFIVAWVSVVAILATYLERRLAGFIQSRLGPNRVGPQGLLQPIADGIKLFLKEAPIPERADPALFKLAPVMVMLGALVPFVALPFGAAFIVADLDVGIFFVLSFAALEVIGVIMAGWASNSKWSLYGGMRLAAQMMSNEIPMGLCALCVVFLAGTLDMISICEQQGFWPWEWFLLRGGPFTLVAGLLFYVSALAATKRAPFDLPEAESELVSGFHTEYSAMPFAFFFMGEYAAMYLVSAVTVVLFGGGYKFPIPLSLAGDGAAAYHALNQGKALTAETAWPALGAAVIQFVNITLKSWILLILMIWLRWTLPRIRLDQVMYMCLKVLLPFSMVCVVGSAVFAVLDYRRLNDGGALPYWIATAVSFAAFAVFVRWGFALSAADPRKRDPGRPPAALRPAAAPDETEAPEL